MGPADNRTEAIDRLLARALRGEEAVWSSRVEGKADAEAVIERVRFHGVASLLVESPAVRAGWPPELVGAVREEAQLQAFWEESHRQTIAELLESLARAGVESRLMKGTALAYDIYEDPSARRRGDTDLLVRENDLAAVRGVLRAAGFGLRDSPHGLFFQETWLHDSAIGFVHAVDLHWRPSDSPVLQRVLRSEEFFADAVPLPRLGPHAYAPRHVLSFVQCALNQAFHGAKGYYVGEERIYGGGRLIWAQDNLRLARGFSDGEWDDLGALARSRKVAPFCLAALELAGKAGNLAIPPDLHAQLAQGAEEDELVRYVQETNQIVRFVTDFRSLETVGERAAFVKGHAFPAREHLQRKYPRSAAWPMAVLHLRRMGEAAVRLLASRAR